jgi:hypothetical protein
MVGLNIIEAQEATESRKRKDRYDDQVQEIDSKLMKDMHNNEVESEAKQALLHSTFDVALTGAR